MGAFAARQVALLPFPFSDISRNKLRPALVIASAERQDWIVCQITSNPVADIRSIVLTDADFTSGGLQRVSYVRPGKVFTAHESLILTIAGTLQPKVFATIRSSIIELIQGY